MIELTSVDGRKQSLLVEDIAAVEENGLGACVYLGHGRPTRFPVRESYEGVMQAIHKSRNSKANQENGKQA